MADVEKWECRVCLHLHEGKEPPENCPVCGAPANEFLPADELRSLYDSAGVTGDHVTFTLCQSGVRAAHTWFVLTDLLGYDDVRMYDGSWVEYGNREDSPIAN